MNRDYLVEQLQLIREYVIRARAISGHTKEQFLSDYLLSDAAVRELSVLFETSHSIAKHLIAESGWRTASSKAEAFEILADNDVVPRDLCDALRQASRFRNLVTYQTSIVSSEVVFDVLRDRLGDFERFALAIAQWLEDNH